VSAGAPEDRRSIGCRIKPLSLDTCQAGVGLTTGSLAVLAAAVDSLMDVHAPVSMLSSSAWRRSSDAEHAYGHEKAEALSGVIQAVIIAIGGFWLVGARALVPASSRNHQEPESRVAVTAFCVAVSLVLVSICGMRRGRHGRLPSSGRVPLCHRHHEQNSSRGPLVGYRVLGWQWLDSALPQS